MTKIVKNVNLRLETPEWTFTYDSGEDAVFVRGVQVAGSFFLSLEDLASLVALKKAIDDLA